ncbi:hypothetical protein SKAU_G00288840 [Synaphobranchus kaupii]|uniref:B30.2/SPRY domain-containing protein n=1 Tax=Synaphobranchus kaupii TaxID=118154 RepID=A0A9Q1ETB1_SYNKA|nr:hypothetical protein SKAU_G00288840 [Synaphobranchus kaupii]
MCGINYSSLSIIDKMMDISRKNGNIIKPVWKWIREATVDVTLDPETAHPSLILSETRKQVRLGSKRADLPDTPQRFNYVICVLGKEGFSSGRHYWEVEMRSKTDWTLGIAMSNASRKGPILFRPRAGYWTIRLKNGVFTAQNETPIPLPLREKPQTVGVYVDYKEGQVSFYNAESRAHIYSFAGSTFTEKLYPVFRPGLTDEGKNSPLLIISPVNHIT